MREQRREAMPAGATTAELDMGYRLPALARPARLDDEGLPLGVQLYGRWSEETALPQAGAAVQRLIEPTRARPAVHVPQGAEASASASHH